MTGQKQAAKTAPAGSRKKVKLDNQSGHDGVASPNQERQPTNSVKPKRTSGLQQKSKRNTAPKPKPATKSKARGGTKLLDLPLDIVEAVRIACCFASRRSALSSEGR